MHRPPPDPRNRSSIDRPTWRRILVSYAMAAAIPLLLWGLGNLLVSAVALAAISILYIGIRRIVELVRCFDDCGGFAFDLGGRVRIAITQPQIDESS